MTLTADDVRDKLQFVNDATGLQVISLESVEEVAPGLFEYTSGDVGYLVCMLYVYGEGDGKMIYDFPDMSRDAFNSMMLGNPEVCDVYFDWPSYLMALVDAYSEI